MKIFIIIMLTLLSFHTITRAQNGYVKRFHSDLSTNVRYSYHQMEKMTKSNNAYNFMALGYYLNANNNMYLKTRDITYLDNILSIIKPSLPSKFTWEGAVKKEIELYRKLLTSK